MIIFIESKEHRVHNKKAMPGLTHCYVKKGVSVDNQSQLVIE